MFESFQRVVHDIFHPPSYEALLDKGRIARANQDWETAHACFTRASRKAPTEVEKKALLAAAYDMRYAPVLAGLARRERERELDHAMDRLGLNPTEAEKEAKLVVASHKYDAFITEDERRVRALDLEQALEMRRRGRLEPKVPANT